MAKKKLPRKPKKAVKKTAKKPAGRKVAAVRGSRKPSKKSSSDT